MKTTENKMATELNQSRQTFAYWKKERPEVYNTIRGYYELREELEKEDPSIDALREVIARVGKNLSSLTQKLETDTIKDLEARMDQATTDKAKKKIMGEYMRNLKKYPQWAQLKRSYQANKA